MNDPLPRCPAPACPVRYRGGEDRLCADHAADTGAAFDTSKSAWNDVIADSSPRA